MDYGALIPVKNRLLDIAAQRFPSKASDEIQARCAAFIAANDTAWLHDYAVFRILKTRHGERPWPEWKPEYVRRDEKALRELETGEAAKIETIKIIQFLFHDQWQRFRDYAHASGITLFGDMPICIALDSSDAWANRDILCLDEDGQPDYVAGVPPDYFSEDGQLWGNPLYDWNMHAADGYRWWVDRLRASAKLADIVRIDHFRGFEAYWSVPADSATARVGAWEPGPGDAIFDAMKAALGTSADRGRGSGRNYTGSRRLARSAPHSGHACAAIRRVRRRLQAVRRRRETASVTRARTTTTQP